MTVQVQSLPVRFAETLNRFGAAPVERSTVVGDVGEPAIVTLGERSVLAKAYGERVTRRGRQTLVAVHGRRTWVASDRVERLRNSSG